MENTEIKIKKAKVSNNGCVEASYTDADGNDVTVKGHNKCHNDLRVALAKLVPYFADLTEQKEADHIVWEELESTENNELLRKLEVTGVSMGSDETNPSITMTGKRTLLTSRVLNLNSPCVELDNDSFAWVHLNNFDIAVQNFFYEVKLYIQERKWEVVQQTFDFEGTDDPFASEPTPTNSVASFEALADESVA